MDEGVAALIGPIGAATVGNLVSDVTGIKGLVKRHVPAVETVALLATRGAAAEAARFNVFGDPGSKSQDWMAEITKARTRDAERFAEFKPPRVDIAVSPVPSLIRELLTVTERQAVEIGLLRDQAIASAEAEQQREARSERRELTMLRMTVASFIVALVSAIVAVVAVLLP